MALKLSGGFLTLFAVIVTLVFDLSNLKSFLLLPTHMMNICAKFQRNISTK